MQIFYDNAKYLQWRKSISTHRQWRWLDCKCDDYDDDCDDVMTRRRWSYRLLWWSLWADFTGVLFVLYFADYNSTSSSSYVAIIIGVLGLLVAIVVPVCCIRLKKARDMENQNRVVTYRRNQQPKVVHHYHQGKSSRCFLFVRRCLLSVRRCFLFLRGCLLSVRGCLLSERGCL